MNETRALKPMGELEGRFWLRMGEKLGEVIAEELGKRDRRLAKLDRAGTRLERPSARAVAGRGAP